MDSSYPETLKTSRLILSQDQINNYMADGYIQFGKILDDYQLNFIRGEYDREIATAREEGYLTDLAQRDGQTESQSENMFQVHAVSAKNIYFNRLVHLDSMLDIVEDLIGPNIRLLRADLLYKPPLHGSIVYWHQDNVFNQCFPANMVTGWLTLDDVNRDNGAMQIIPGSHLRPTWEDWGEHVEKLDTLNARVVELPAGGIMFHHCQVLHHSTPNRSDRPRRAVAIRFLPIGTQSPRLRTDEWRFFMHPILRMKV
jgi:phytanoyl-CoA hydroxylase